MYLYIKMTLFIDAIFIVGGKFVFREISNS